MHARILAVDIVAHCSSHVLALSSAGQRLAPDAWTEARGHGVLSCVVSLNRYLVGNKSHRVSSLGSPRRAISVASFCFADRGLVWLLDHWPSRRSAAKN